jgi:hypothetical protein
MCSDHEPAVYTRQVASRRLLINVYVDDLLITCPVDNDINKFKTELQEHFRMSDFGLLTYYRWIEVGRLLEKTGLADCNPSQTPMESRLQLSKSSPKAQVNAIEYRSVVRALRYLVHTHPDLAHSASFVSRFVAAPRENHQAAVKQILQYVAGTQDHGICYGRGNAGNLCLLGYSESYHAGDVDDNMSTSRILFYPGGSPILAIIEIEVSGPFVL